MCDEIPALQAHCILGNPGLQWGGGREGKWEQEKREKGGGGGGRKRAKGRTGNLLYTEHFSIEEQTPLARCETEALV